jgi:tRNA (Thr-GGU) A37 N-methylase
VRGLEAFDGTPVLDIKPYTPERVIADVGVPRWYSDLDVLVEEEKLRRAHGQPRV